MIGGPVWAREELLRRLAAKEDEIKGIMADGNIKDWADYGHSAGFIAGLREAAALAADIQREQEAA